MNKNYFSIILLFCFVISGLSLDAESYNVLHVKGLITLKKTGATLKQGDVIDSEDQVSFGSKDAVAALFSRSRGRFTLSPQGSNEKYGGEFFAYVKSNLVPAQKALSTRAGDFIKNAIELQNHFGRDQYLILDKTEVHISKDAFPMSDKSFFYIRYDLEDDENPVNKKLMFDEETLYIDINDLFSVDDATISPDKASGFSLYYYSVDEEKSTSTKVSDIHLVIPDEEELEKEIKVMVDLMVNEKANDSEIRDEVKSYIIEYYGQPDKDNLDHWLSEKFKL